MSDVIQINNPDIVRVTSAGADILSVGIQGPQGIQGDAGPAGQGVPVGGTALQLLTKVDATNYNTVWASLVASQIPVLDAAKITTGIFDVARIPTLTLSKISDAGTMATQNANAVAITGGTINGTTIGATTPSSGVFTSVSTNTIQGQTTSTNQITFASGSNGVSMVANGNSISWSGAAFIPGSSGSRDLGTSIAQWRDSYINRYIVAGTGIAIGTNGVAPTVKLQVVHSDAGTADTQNVLVIGRNSSGTPAANFASRLLWQLESSTTENRDAAAIDVVWTTATDATRTSRMDFYVTGSASLTSSMSVLASAIGMGTNNPQARLHTAIPSAGSSHIGIISDVAVNNSAATSQLGYSGPQLILANTQATNNIWSSIYFSPSAAVTTPIAAIGARFTSRVNLVGEMVFEIRSGVLGTASPSGFRFSSNNYLVNTIHPFVYYDAITGQTPSSGYGQSHVFRLSVDPLASGVRAAAAIETSWVTIADASRTARQVFNIYDTAAREAMRLEASGSAPMIGFLGAAAVIRQALGAWAGLTTDQKLDALRNALTNLGLTSYT